MNDGGSEAFLNSDLDTGCGDAKVGADGLRCSR